MSDDFPSIDVFEQAPFADPGEGVIDITPAPGVVLRPDPSYTPTPESERANPAANRDAPRALFFSSAEGGTGVGHVVIVQANGDLTCICWPALRSPRGCHAMVATRTLLGLPPVE